jgi:acyl dehydratase
MTMITRDLTSSKSTLSTFLTAWGTGSKRPGRVTELPAIMLVRPLVTLDAAHIVAYRRICGFSDKHGVPMIYPQMLTFPLAMAYALSDECPWPALGTVHLGNVIEQHAPLVAGDTVRVELQSGDLFSHEKGQGYSFDLRILRDGALVWSAKQSVLRVGVQDKSGAPYASSVHAQMDTPLSLQTAFDAPADIGRRYSVVSGDRNPIHLSALSAKLLGFRRAIAHGMWTNARALSCLLPDEPLQAATLAVDFKTPLFLPGRATLWTNRHAHGAQFEVRDAKGVKPHLRGQLQY